MHIPAEKILQLAIDGHFETGINFYAQQKNPTPEERRWAGVCLIGLQKFSAAFELLTSAYAAGCDAAAIEISSLYRKRGESQQSHALLSQINLEKLSAFDQALALRELGGLHYHDGNLSKATTVLQKALVMASKTSHTQYLTHHIAYPLALMLSARGQTIWALELFERALVTATQPGRAYVFANRALCNTYLGLFKDAEADLEAAKNEHNPIIEPLLAYCQAKLKHATGNLTEAAEYYEQSVQLAQNVGENETELYAVLGLASIFTAQKNPNQAKIHLARAAHLAQNSKALAMLHLRQGALQCRLADPKGIANLQAALKSFENLELKRETAWAHLNLAEAYLATTSETTEILDKQNQQINFHLEAATDIHCGFGKYAESHGELYGLPHTQKYLQSLPTDNYIALLIKGLNCSPVSQLEIKTLGTTMLIVDGSRIKLNAGLDTVVEVLCYLLLHPNRNLDQILSAVFSNTSTDKGKNYFHLIRNELRRTIPGLSIPFNDNTKTYWLDTGGKTVRWDALQLSQHIAQDKLEMALDVYHGPFLVKSEHEWVQQKRDSLESSLIGVGIQHAEHLLKQKEYERAIRITEQLLAILPFDTTLIEITIQATKGLHGQGTARFKRSRIQQQLKAELGVTPEIAEV